VVSFPLWPESSTARLFDVLPVGICFMGPCLCNRRQLLLGHVLPDFDQPVSKIVRAGPRPFRDLNRREGRA